MKDVAALRARAKYTKWFNTHHLTGDIKRKSVKGGINTVFSQLLSFGMTMASTSVMARLIAPESYGLVAMVSAFTGFVLIFKDLGFTSAVIQRSVISQKQISTLFWLNLAISLVISLIVAAIGPFLVTFYNEPRLLNITFAIAGTIFLTGSVLQHGALMKRQMRFKRLSAVHITATAVSIVTGIVMALLKFDYWALVGSSMAYSVVYTVLLWVLCDWRPDFVFQFSRVKSIMRFGAGITGFDVVNYFSRNADNMLVGRYFGSSILGLYSKSYQLLMLPITQLRDPLNAVALPALSSLKMQHEKYREFYARYNFILAFFSMPLVVFLLVFSKEVVELILGKQWLEASYIFQMLAVTALIQPVAGTKGVVMITMGYVRRYFFWGIANAVITVAAFVLGMQWGINGMVIAYAVVNYAILVPSLIFCLKGSPVSVALFFREIALPFELSVFVGGVCFLFKQEFSNLGPIWLLCVGFVLGAGCYLIPWTFTRYTREKLKQVMEMKKFIGK